MRLVRVFVSSPGDTHFERMRVERVVERLNGEFSGIAKLEAIRWESQHYKAHTTFQKQVGDGFLHGEWQLLLRQRVVQHRWVRIKVRLQENKRNDFHCSLGAF